MGQTAAPLYSYFSLVADDPSVQIVSIAQMWYIKENLKGGQYADLPLLSAAAPFKAGGKPGPDYYTDVPVGPVAIKNVADLYLYPNTIRAVEITGAKSTAMPAEVVSSPSTVVLAPSSAGSSSDMPPLVTCAVASVGQLIKRFHDGPPPIAACTPADVHPAVVVH